MVTRQAHYKIFLFAALLGVELTQGQVQRVGSTSGVPEAVLQLREHQARLAAEAGITIRVKDEGQRSSTMIIEGVPDALRDAIIANEYDLISLLDEVYPYYGFTGSESLEFTYSGQIFDDIAYSFVEYIDGIQTPVLFDIFVNPQTRRINRFRGWLELDRDLERSPSITEQEAVNVAICVVQEYDQFRPDNFQLDGPHEVDVVYRHWGWDGALTPFWKVTLAPPAGNPTALREAFWIGPDGVLQRSMFCDHCPEFVMPPACMNL